MRHDVDEHGHEVVRCIDNGAGMDRGVIERFLTNAGRSYYRSPEFEQERASFRAANVDFDPCAQFGIGFMSCFMLGDHVIIHTRRDYGPNRGLGEPLVIEINGLGGIVVIREGQQDQAVGTTVEIRCRRKPRFVDEFIDQVKLLEVIEGYCLACEFPVEAICSVPEIAGSVIIPPEITKPRTALEESGLGNFITLEQNFSDVHPSLSGSARASFIVNDDSQVTLANKEANWSAAVEGSMARVRLVKSTGEEIESYYSRRESQICMDGILVTGHPGRDSRSEARSHYTIGYGGPPFSLGRTLYTLDIRGEIKPPLTPARTLPEDRSLARGLGSRWNYISAMIDKTNGRLWEQVARQLSNGLSPETFWQLAIIYSEHETNIYWMRAGGLWSLISVPILYEDRRHEWKRLSALGTLDCVPVSEELEAGKKKSTKYRLECADGGYIDTYDALKKWRATNADRLIWDINHLIISMSTLTVDDNNVRLELRRPSQPEVPPWEFVITGGSDLVSALPHSGEIKDYYSAHLLFRSINRDHPLAAEALRSRYLENPSPIQEFATSAAHLMSSDEWIETLVNPTTPPRRWHKYVGSKFVDVDWSKISPELHPPYKLLLETGETIQVSKEDFERWANITEYEW